MRTRSSMRRGKGLNRHLMSLVSMVYPRCLRSPPGRADLGRICSGSYGSWMYRDRQAGSLLPHGPGHLYHRVLSLVFLSLINRFNLPGESCYQSHRHWNKSLFTSTLPCYTGCLYTFIPSSTCPSLSSHRLSLFPPPPIAPIARVSHTALLVALCRLHLHICLVRHFSHFPVS